MRVKHIVRVWKPGFGLAYNIENFMDVNPSELPEVVDELLKNKSTKEIVIDPGYPVKESEVSDERRFNTYG